MDDGSGGVRKVVKYKSDSYRCGHGGFGRVITCVCWRVKCIMQGGLVLWGKFVFVFDALCAVFLTPCVRLLCAHRQVQHVTTHTHGHMPRIQPTLNYITKQLLPIITMKSMSDYVFTEK